MVAISAEGLIVGAGDASGGEHTADPGIRRVGWAFCWLAADLGTGAVLPRATGGAGGAHPGRRQTVSRGEAWAFKAFLEESPASKAALYYADSSYVVKGFNKCCNGDLASNAPRCLEGHL